MSYLQQDIFQTRNITLRNNTTIETITDYMHNTAAVPSVTGRDKGRLPMECSNRCSASKPCWIKHFENLPLSEIKKNKIQLRTGP